MSTGKWTAETFERRHHRRLTREAARREQILEALRCGNAMTAQALGELLGYSIRTIYRDIEGLRDEGHRIRGAAGFGYVLDQRRAAA